MQGRIPIATSRYSAGLWAAYLGIDIGSIHVVYPFAEPAFAAQTRAAPPSDLTRILYAGRLSPEKGIYTLLAMLHIDVIADDPNLSFTVTTAGSDKPQGQIIEQLVNTHPGIRMAEACSTPDAMAALMAEHDIVLMPSNGQYWHETFGIVSIEAQHAGCRVVASDDGGLPETDCGAVTYVEPDNAEALAWGIRQAITDGPVTPAARSNAATRFTRTHSVDALLDILSRYGHRASAYLDRELEELIQLPSLTPCRRAIHPCGSPPPEHSGKHQRVSSVRLRVGLRRRPATERAPPSSSSDAATRVKGIVSCGPVLARFGVVSITAVVTRLVAVEVDAP